MARVSVRIWQRFDHAALKPSWRTCWHAFPLKRHEGSLTFTPILICWFSTTAKLPLKITSSVRYGFGGKDYAYERASGMPPFVVYEATDFKNAFAELWFPYAGTQRTYVPDYERVKTFDADSVVDAILADGKYIDTDPYLLSTKREWKVLKLESLSRGTDLWFDPPDGVAVRDVDTNTFRIAGKSDEDSLKILGATSPSQIGVQSR